MTYHEAFKRAYIEAGVNPAKIDEAIKQYPYGKALYQEIAFQPAFLLAAGSVETAEQVYIETLALKLSLELTKKAEGTSHETA